MFQYPGRGTNSGSWQKAPLPGDQRATSTVSRCAPELIGLSASGGTVTFSTSCAGAPQRKN